MMATPIAIAVCGGPQAERILISRYSRFKWFKMADTLVDRTSPVGVTPMDLLALFACPSFNRTMEAFVTFVIGECGNDATIVVDDDERRLNGRSFIDIASEVLNTFVGDDGNRLYNCKPFCFQCSDDSIPFIDQLDAATTWVRSPYCIQEQVFTDNRKLLIGYLAVSHGRVGRGSRTAKSHFKLLWDWVDGVEAEATSDDGELSPRQSLDDELNHGLHPDYRALPSSPQLSELAHEPVGGDRPSPIEEYQFREYMRIGTDVDIAQAWSRILYAETIDDEAQRNLFLLAQSSDAGRARAMKIMWCVFTRHIKNTLIKNPSAFVMRSVQNAFDQIVPNVAPSTPSAGANAPRRGKRGGCKRKRGAAQRGGASASAS